MPKAQSSSRWIRLALLLTAACGASASAQTSEPRREPVERGSIPEPLPNEASPSPAQIVDIRRIPSPPTILKADVKPIDLNTALRLANVQNPEFNVARQRVLEAVALRQLAAAQFLPSLNPGMNYDTHSGNLQQSNGNILSVQRSAVYVGAGSGAVAAGTVNIPGVFLSGNTATVIFEYLQSRQFVRQRQFDNIAVRNQVFLQVAVAYSELIRAEARRVAAFQNREEARTIARLTSDYAQAGQGRPADANRAATELARRESYIQQVEAEVISASARLCALLNLDPSTRLHPTDAFIVPHPVVPDPIPISELLALGLLHRPELGAQRAAVERAMLALSQARALPFSPNLFLGFSAGTFGGGSNLVRPIFGNLSGRTDFDVVTYWTARNLGVGNVAMIRAANANLQINRYQQIEVLNLVREQIAEAYARTHARFAQIEINESAIRAGVLAFEEDLDRIRFRGERDVLPIELLNSFKLLAESRIAYIDAIVDYNNAQFEMYVALGQPPANTLARPVPTEGVQPTHPPEAEPSRSGSTPSARPATAQPPNPTTSRRPTSPVAPVQ
jgi:outer membrane protein TolC